MSFEIIGTGRGEPDFRLTNAILEKMVDTSDEWITQRTGISERRVMVDETMRDLALKSAREALKDGGITPDQLGYILFATISGEYRTPSQASILAMDLGVDCAALDLNAACTGFLYGLDMADALFQANKAEYILVVGMEIMSRYLDYTDRRTCILFGDGGGAVLLKKGNGLKAIHASGKGNIDVLNIPNVFPDTPWHKETETRNTIEMNGREVYKFAVGAFLDELNLCLNRAGMTAQDLDLVIPHQANSRIIESARERLGVSEETFINQVADRGNTSAGSIPLLLDELNRSGKLKKGMMLGLVAFGGGLTSAGAILEWTKE
ncbi:beta-ketoacyl-ACP synthase III [Proteiniclasticum sp. QWL-01]|uniref:3-oxoacyl-ACP synthase III family protein n=1 Tax=Proteiniclasticum sp. QWL-01 TaxID=3036945 RepID=UPI00240EA52E|nr:beta-ketoacyl-ACP synthase III [Proteiniclasticum sp. QWL-01]WFF71465.1 ketoacyl-ACP synthase III [Proteiniclasticum sp. QWL-01]